MIIRKVILIQVFFCIRNINDDLWIYTPPNKLHFALV